MKLYKRCRACKGAGTIFASIEWIGDLSRENRNECPQCHGAGKVLTGDGEAVAALVRRILAEKP